MDSEWHVGQTERYIEVVAGAVKQVEQFTQFG